MTTTYNLSISKNPQFQTVLSLANTTFDRTNVRSGYMATEDQIQQLWQDIVRLEERIDYCCRDIVFWDFRVRINDKNGNLISDYLANRTTGIMRRGKNFTMKLPIKAVPKYESQHTFNAGSSTTCLADGSSRYLPINGLCSILYRGTEGEYYDMSVRKNGYVLPGNVNIGSTSTVSNPPSNINFTAVSVDINGNIGNYPFISNNNAVLNTHFARVDENNDIYMDVYQSVNQPVVIMRDGNPALPYGRIYYLNLRDVTLG